MTDAKPRVFWHNYMGMHRDLEEAKCWTPESEMEDLRQYVELAEYQVLERKLAVMKCLVEYALPVIMRAAEVETEELALTVFGSWIGSAKRILGRSEEKI